ncbi:MAG: YicC family protein [Alphaproteobacteria bacterium]|nr:YicC family protein [Alphaproteobacteria bacterium]
MPVSSMTGFARKNGECTFGKVVYNWFFEIKSVNGKSLDVKIKQPVWLEALNSPFKSLAAKYFNRGCVSVFLEVKASGGVQKVNINTDLLTQLSDAAVSLWETYGDKIQKPSASELLGIRGVADVEDVCLSEDEQSELEKKLLADFEEVCKALRQDRINEGEKISQALLDIVAKIGKIVQKVESISQSMQKNLKDRLLQHIQELLGAENQISEDRLAQEVVFYVTRADIQEEVDRLKAHLKTAEELLNSNEPVGRRLDFLCQELNREANTTCSKSSDIVLTNLGMELKTLIEQLREQVQNME